MRQRSASMIGLLLLVVAGGFLLTEPGQSQAALPAQVQATITPTSIPLITNPIKTPIPALIRIYPRLIASKAISIALIAAFGFGLAWLVQKFLHSVLSRVHPEIQVFTSRIASIAIVIATILWILSVFNVNSATLATVLGSFGLAISLSAQDLFKNLVAGVYLLMERPFVVGDVISVGAYTGQVVVVDMRTITLRTPDDQLVIVPNTLVMSQIVVRKLNVNPEPVKSPPAADTPPEVK